MSACELCSREKVETTNHHLIPRTRHKNKRTKRETEPADRLKTVALCQACHRHIHNLISEKEMERTFNTIEKLKRHPGVLKFIEWIKTRSVGASLKSR